MNLTNTKYGIMMYYINDLYIAESLNQSKVYEEDMVTLYLSEHIKKSKYICDVGAHIGCHSLMYSHYSPSAKIYSFEPQVQLYNMLRFNMSSNRCDNVNIYNCAVGHINGKARMSRNPTDGPNVHLPISYGQHACNLGGIQLGNNGEEVEMKTVDSLDLPGCDFIKIDVEGFEPMVLTGAEQTIKRYRPTIFFEQNHKVITQDMKDYFNLNTDSLKSSHEILRQHGYIDFKEIDGNYLTVHPSRQ